MPDCADTLLQQHRPTRGPVLDVCARMIYIDNFASLSTCRAKAQADCRLMLDRLAARSIVAVPEGDDDPRLGYELDEACTRWTPTPQKFWRIAFALRDVGMDKQAAHGTTDQQDPWSRRGLVWTSL